MAHPLLRRSQRQAKHPQTMLTVCLLAELVQQQEPLNWVVVCALAC
jgi:hypothetical protein